MSKIGRKPIDISNAQVVVQDKTVSYKGKKATGEHHLPRELSAEVVDGKLILKIVKQTKTSKALWGLHRSLLANKIYGAVHGFERQLRIIGLGYKALITGNKVQFSLGFSHKIDFILPTEVTLEVDKSGQLLTFKSSNKETLGLVCSKVRDLRPPEPYKGTGIQYVGEVILRKAGKAKAAA